MRSGVTVCGDRFASFRVHDRVLMFLLLVGGAGLARGADKSALPTKGGIMRRAIFTFGAAAAVAVVALAVGRVAPGVTAASAGTSDIAFTEGICSDAGAHCKTINVPGNGIGFGTRILFSLPLTSSGTKVGRDKGECVYLNLKSRQVYCNFVVRLSGGTVSVQGALPAIFDKAGTIPVTGGTGAYEGAYGHLTELATPSPRIHYELHVVTP
jgi:hypothetical protein